MDVDESKYYAMLNALIGMVIGVVIMWATTLKVQTITRILNSYKIMIVYDMSKE